MAPANNAHTRSHSLLLLQKLLNLRDGASPLTLILDSLEGTAQPLISEFFSRAKISKAKVIFLSFTTLKKPRDADVFVKAAGKELKNVRTELVSHYPPFDPSTQKDKPTQRCIVVIDSLNALASSAPHAMASFLSSVLTPAVSLVPVYHTDVPVILPPTWNEYEPHPFTVLCHLATAILRLSSLQQEIERQKARNRSLVEPEWGLKEDREGVLIGLTEPGKDADRHGVVIDMDLRRRSGRTVSEKFILVPAPSGAGPGKVFLLADHTMFKSPEDSQGGDGEDEPESTFNLGLTEKQRKDREGIVLPYFDAQTDIGAGEGGRILYEMGREDDFDDEEDEI
ncbi:unnamed protein product [Clonostachys rosea f. rosea IK726]|uniref:Elongator complex protein 5 n=2 Tax=Bionectria ochroleuca TaxID=29856 RepID=A0A8H7N588_BIOOC|nr:unnamed protein product [Clonostachys rosea f. rosea IK726]